MGNGVPKLKWERQEMVWEIDVKPSEKLLLLALLFHLGENKDSWPSQDKLAHELRVGPRQVRKLVDSLVKKGLIFVTRGHRHYSNRYRLNWDLITQTGTPVPVQSGTPDPISEELQALSVRNSSSYQTGTVVPTNNSKNHSKNHSKNKGANGASKKLFCWRLKREEFSDHSQLEERYRQAVKSGWLADTEGNRLGFHTAAVYAARTGKSPGALFTKFCRDDGWKGTDADEDVAVSALRTLDHPAGSGRLTKLADKFATELPEGIE